MRITEAINKMPIREIVKRSLPSPVVLHLKRHYSSRCWKLVIPKPRSVMIELTNACQFRCAICPRISTLGRGMEIGHMDFERFREFVDDNVSSLEAITLTGLGEPFLYPLLREAVEYIRKKDDSIYVYLSTNASASKICSWIDDIADQIDHLQISADGVGGVFESIRKKGDYETFLQNVRAISERSRGKRMELSFNTVVLKENCHQMVDIIRLAKTHDVPSIHFSTLNLAGTDHDLSYYSFYFSREYRTEIRKALWAALKSNVRVVFHHVGLRNEFKDCDLVWGNFFVTWDGWLVPCCGKPFYREMNFGNVFQSGLLDCINSAKAIEFRRMALNGATPEFCVRCHRFLHRHAPVSSEERSCLRPDAIAHG